MSIIKDYDNYFLPANNLDTAKDFTKTNLGFTSNLILLKKEWLLSKLVSANQQ
jgi:hypothetical protein